MHVKSIVVFSAIASKPDEIGCTFDNSCRNIFHGTSVLYAEKKEKNGRETKNIANKVK